MKETQSEKIARVLLNLDFQARRAVENKQTWVAVQFLKKIARIEKRAKRGGLM